MRVRIFANSPLPQVKAWLPLNASATGNVISVKGILVTSIPAFRALSPSSLRLSIDGFELLDTSDISVVRDGDLICVDAQDGTARENAVTLAKRVEPDASHKRKRPLLSSSSSGSEMSGTDTTSGSETSSSDSDSSESESDSSRPTTPALQKPEARTQVTLPVQPQPHAVQPSSFVPPGYGKPETRARNLRRRLKRMHDHEATGGPEGGPVSGANAVVPGRNVPAEAPAVHEDSTPMLMSLSLRNKNKAKNFKALMNKPLPPKIVFDDEVGAPEAPKPSVLPRLIPPSSRASLPPNMFVTSVDVEAGMRRRNGKKKMRVAYGDEPEYVDFGAEVDVDRLGSTVDQQWEVLDKVTRDKVKPGMTVGCKGLGINPVTYTPEEMVTVGVVVSCEKDTVVVRQLRGISFGGPVEAEGESHAWDDVERSDWRIVARD